MVDEKHDEYDNQEDSEYHFSDDQSTYELEPEVEAETAKVSSAASEKTNLLDKANKYRRTIIIVGAFFILLFVVYKLIIPSTSTTPTTEFSDTTSGNVAQKPAAVKPLVPVQTPTTVQTAPPQTPPIPPAASLPMEQPNPMSMAMPPQQMAMPQQLPATLPTSQPTEMMPPPAPPVVVAGPSNLPPGVTNAPPATSVPERVTTLEQQNARIMSVVGTEYAQKIAEYESQNTATQAKIREMNTRLSNMEATLNQITQMLLNKQGPSQVSNRASGMAPPPSSLPMMKSSSEPRMVYTVQAIIPGRAWLKAENGDTVTVAEGDILRDYGRIAKIDPYDGVVEIDTGSKTISLSYGSGSDV